MKKSFGIFFSGLLAGVLLTYVFTFHAKERDESPVSASAPTQVLSETLDHHVDPHPAREEKSAVQADDLSTKYDDLLEEYGRIDSHLLPEDLPFTIVSTTADSSEEIVVYAALPPRENDLERKIYVLRLVNQVIRDNKDVQRISIWENETLAQKYANGDYDNSKTILGWEGFDARAAFVVKDENGIRVQYALGRDDFLNISFGMGRIEF